MVVLLANAVVSAVYSTQSTERQLLAQEYQSGLLVVGSKADMLSSALTNFDGDVRLLAFNSVVQNYLVGRASSDELVGFFNRVFNRNRDLYEGGCVVEPSGQERVCVSNIDSEHAVATTEGLPAVGERSDIKAVLKEATDTTRTGEVVVTGFDVVKVRDSGALLPLLRFDAVIRGSDDASIMAIVSMEVKAANVLDALDTSNLDASFRVVDANSGEFLYGTAEESLYGVTLGTGPSLFLSQPRDAAQLLLNRTGYLVGEDTDMPGYIQVYTPVRASGFSWALIYERSLAPFSAESARVRRTEVLISLVSVMLGVGIVVVLTRGIVHPLSALRAVALKIADTQDYGLLLPEPRGGPEVSSLTRGLSLLMRTVNHEIEVRTTAELELSRHVRNMEKLISVAAVINVVSDMSGLADRIGSVVSDVFGVSARIFVVSERGVWDSTGAGELEPLINGVISRGGAERAPCLLALGLFWDHALRGVLGVISESVLSERDVDTYLILSRQISVVLENAGLYAEQVATAEELRKASVVKDNFLANMSHELRTPLNIILGHTNTILAELDPSQLKLDLGEFSSLFGSGQSDSYVLQLEAVQVDSTYLAGQVMHIHDAGGRLLTLINDLLDITKIEADRMEVSNDWFDIRDFVDRLMAQSSSLNSRNLRLVSSVGGEVPRRIYGDENKFERIFLNLLSNAFKFTREGSVEVYLNIVRERLTLRVVDTGIGIADKNQALIFEAFRQVDTGYGREFGGTGLGLHIVQRYCRLLGGGIRVESELGHGSTFVVWLPLVREGAIVSV